ncbi:hypothetical protein [Caballeronia sp. GAFFF2]|uniref:hypothetical protein n=1 Tax=Caballeronia sp. GAFFF2 TaxID=2921741 RepID=UPI00202834F1|nr:hypothetical protein [Caballeronia sp. GAFFF2]
MTFDEWFIEQVWSGSKLARSVAEKTWQAAIESMKSDKKEAKSCRTGYYDICHAAKFDGVVCPEDECDIDDGVRAVAKRDKQEAMTCRCRCSGLGPCEKLANCRLRKSDKQEAVMSREDWKELYNIAYDHDSFERFMETAKFNLAANRASEEGGSNG